MIHNFTWSVFGHRVVAQFYAGWQECGVAVSQTNGTLQYCSSLGSGKVLTDHVISFMISSIARPCGWISFGFVHLHLYPLSHTQERGFLSSRHVTEINKQKKRLMMYPHTMNIHHQTHFLLLF